MPISAQIAPQLDFLVVLDYVTSVRLAHFCTPSNSQFPSLLLALPNRLLASLRSALRVAHFALFELLVACDLRRTLHPRLLLAASSRCAPRVWPLFLVTRGSRRDTSITRAPGSLRSLRVPLFRSDCLRPPPIPAAADRALRSYRCSVWLRPPRRDLARCARGRFATKRFTRSAFRFLGSFLNRSRWSLSLARRLSLRSRALFCSAEP